jgi:hypothetical protein
MYIHCGYFEISKSNLQLHLRVQDTVEIDQCYLINSRHKNNIPGQKICTSSSLMRVSRILQLFSSLSLNATILRRIHSGILDNLSTWWDSR